MKNTAKGWMQLFDCIQPFALSVEREGQANIGSADISGRYYPNVVCIPIFHVAVRLLSEDTVFFRERRPSFCIDGNSPLWTEYFINSERNAPNFVIITLKPRLFRFFLKILPSFAEH